MEAVSNHDLKRKYLMPIILPSERPSHWKDDKLGRSEQAKFLTDFTISEHARLRAIRDKTGKDELDKCPCHFFPNIDSPWGLGKTFFKALEDRSRRKGPGEVHHLLLLFR